MDIREQIERLRNIQDCWAGDLCEAADTMEKLLAALESIAANTCCEPCQEAALVARAALEGQEQDDG